MANFADLLDAISSTFEINVDAFRACCYETAERFITLYPWKKMTPTVHKLLIHSADVVARAPLPIGWFTEESQEARNKEITQFREHCTRKPSRLHCNEDMLHMMFQTSDPLIGSLRNRPSQSEPLRPSVLRLLKQPS